jgi:hypothetical protein
MEKKDKSGSAIAALILGLFSLIAWLIPIFGLPISIIGLILGIVGFNSSKRGIAIAGITITIITLIFGTINSAIGAYLGYTGQLFRYQPAYAPVARPISTRFFSPTVNTEYAWNAPTRVSQGGCLVWSDVTASMEGQNKCVFGYMVSQDQGDHGAYIRFSNSGSAFYFIDLYQEGYYEYNIKPGDCVQGEGIVKEYQGIPRIEVTGLKNCN